MLSVMASAMFRACNNTRKTAHKTTITTILLQSNATRLTTVRNNVSGRGHCQLFPTEEEYNHGYSRLTVSRRHSGACTLLKWQHCRSAHIAWRGILSFHCKGNALRFTHFRSVGLEIILSQQRRIVQEDTIIGVRVVSYMHMNIMPGLIPSNLWTWKPLASFCVLISFSSLKMNQGILLSVPSFRPPWERCCYEGLCFYCCSYWTFWIFRELW